MADLGSLVLNLRLQSAAFIRDMTKASNAVATNTAQMRKHLRQMEQAGRSVERQIGQFRAAAVSLAGALAVRQFSTWTRAAIESGGAIKDVAAKVGVTTTALQQLRFSAAQVGVAQTALDMGLQRFSRRLGEAAQGSGELKDTLKQYGIAARDSEGHTRPVVEVLGDVAEAIKNAGSAQEQLRIAFKAFDSEGAALVNMLKDGRVALERYMQQAIDFGAVMSAEVVAKAKLASDNLTTLQHVFNASFNTAIVEGFADSLMLSRDSLEAARIAGENFGTFVGTAMKGVAEAAEFAGRYLHEVATAIGIIVAHKAATHIVGLASAFLKYASAVKAAAVGQGVLNVAMAAFPLTRLISLAAGAAVALYAMKDASISVGDTTIQVGKVVNAVWVTVSNTIGGTITWFYKLSEAVGKFLLLDAKGAFKSLQESGAALNTALENIKKAWSDLGPPARDGAEEVKKAMAEIEEAVSNAQIRASSAVQKSIESLERENQQLIVLKAAYQQGAEAVKAANDNREVQNKLIELGLTLQDEEGRKVAELVVANRELERQIDKTRRAQEEYARLAEQAFDRVGSAITEMMVKGKGAALDWRDVMLGVISEVYQAFLKLAVINPMLNSMFGGDRQTFDWGGIFGSIAGAFGGGGDAFAANRSSWLSAGSSLGTSYYAAGTDSAKRGWAVVGEEGPELTYFGGGEPVIPAGLTRAVMEGGGEGGGGPTVNIYAPQADREGLRRLEATVVALDGSIERRTKSAIIDAQRRGGAAMRAAFR